MDNNEFNEFTLFDVFTKNNLLYLILSINNNPIDENDIELCIDDKKLQLYNNYVKDSIEPILILIYHNNTTNNSVNIKYKNIERILNIDYVDSEKKGELALTTLFKNDYKYFKLFYDYYSNEGVDHFYMYYNGELTDKIKEHLDYPNVTLIQWNFRYRNNINNKYRHHAQPGQLHHALYKFGKINYDFMIFNDMDEFFYIENNSLKEFIQKNNTADVLQFCNIFAKTIDNKIPEKIPNEFFCSNIKWCYGKRSKNIYRTNSVKLIGIHIPYQYNFNTILSGFDMFHFKDWNKQRNVNETFSLFLLKKGVAGDIPCTQNVCKILINNK